ncbi:hypothetical protein [Parasitella parasitica]|uniref:Uncharacterized protein n=1 Tax=Parasitella parasitica TaxID=35722 RepID=A0A0B7NN51_9FUNG|nr:hypothetical protein [Parasitella parasitica]
MASVPLLVALSKTGKLPKASALTPSCYDKKQELTESELGQFLELLSADESDVLEFGGLELDPNSFHRAFAFRRSLARNQGLTEEKQAGQREYADS